MEITTHKSWLGGSIQIESENTTIEESFLIREYDEQFKVKSEDVSTDLLNTFQSALQDLLYYRKQPFDSCALIELAFEKLPAEIGLKLLKTLNETYQPCTEE